MKESVLRDFGKSLMAGDVPMPVFGPGEVPVDIKAYDRRNPFACSEDAALHGTFAKVRLSDPIAQRRRLHGTDAGAQPA